MSSLNFTSIMNADTLAVKAIAVEDLKNGTSILIAFAELATCLPGWSSEDNADIDRQCVEDVTNSENDRENDDSGDDELTSDKIQPESTIDWDLVSRRYYGESDDYDIDSIDDLDDLPDFERAFYHPRDSELNVYEPGPSLSVQSWEVDDEVEDEVEDHGPAPAAGVPLIVLWEPDEDGVLREGDTVHHSELLS